MEISDVSKARYFKVDPSGFRAAPFLKTILKIDLFTFFKHFELNSGEDRTSEGRKAVVWNTFSEHYVLD